MQFPSIPSERQPMLWMLSGLLLISIGLFVGLESTAPIAAIIIGLLCSVFGIILYLLQLQERPKSSAQTRLSPDFISAGSTVQMPSPKVDSQQ